MLKILLFLLFIGVRIGTSYAEIVIEGETEYIDLIQGVYVDKKYEDLPDKSIFKFENKKFKKYVDLVYDNDRKMMRFKPKRKGSTIIRFVNKRDPDLIIKQIKVTVQERNLDRVAKEIKSLLGEIEGIEIKILNNKVIVDGYILLAKDLNRIAMVLEHYDPKQVVSIVRLSPLTRVKIAERIEAQIDDPNIYVEVINDYFILGGNESFSGQKAIAGEYAQALISDILSKPAESSVRGGSTIVSVRSPSNPIINNIRLLQKKKPPSKKIIQIVVHYVELSKTYGKGFNFSWAPTFVDTGNLELNGNNVNSSNIIESLSTTISNLLPRLNWARHHGHARILDTMNVTTEEGKKGTVNSEKQISRLQTTEQGGVSPQIVKANVKTEATPTIDQARPDNIKLDLNIQIGEISEVSAAANTTSTNQVQTVITVRNKRSAAIAGLLRSSSSTAYNKTPNANLNALFRMGASKDLDRSQSQFVIFVTPIIKYNASEGIDHIKRKFRLDK